MSKLKEQSEITERNNSITERKIKNERGITLIALIITIIILLILAGITINLALAPDGIIKRAQTAGEEYRKEQDKEVAGINELTNLLDKIGAGEESKGTKWTYDHKTQTVTNGTDTFEVGDYVNHENPAS